MQHGSQSTNRIWLDGHIQNTQGKGNFLQRSSSCGLGSPKGHQNYGRLCTPFLHGPLKTVRNLLFVYLLDDHIQDWWREKYTKSDRPKIEVGAVGRIYNTSVGYQLLDGTRSKLQRLLRFWVTARSRNAESASSRIPKPRRVSSKRSCHGVRVLQGPTETQKETNR